MRFAGLNANDKTSRRPPFLIKCFFILGIAFQWPTFRQHKAAYKINRQNKLGTRRPFYEIG